MSFAEIEEIMGASLPHSARTQRAWWSNRKKGGLQAGAWLGAGYYVMDLDLENERVIFGHPMYAFTVERDGDLVLWNGGLVRALRYHMDVTQSELAKELSMRQQTISEWETGMYEPSRTTSRRLSKLAKRVGFDFGDEKDET